MYYPLIYVLQEFHPWTIQQNHHVTIYKHVTAFGLGVIPLKHPVVTLLDHTKSAVIVIWHFLLAIKRTFNL